MSAKVYKRVVFSQATPFSFSTSSVNEGDFVAHNHLAWEARGAFLNIVLID